jgi:flagellar basal body-associated protein FliL
MKKLIIFGGIGLVVVVAAILVVVFVVLPGGEPKELPDIKFALEEMYTNIPVGDDAGSYKILKLQMTIVYKDEDFTETLTKRSDEITDFVNGYFRDVTLETVNRKNGKDRVKEEITEELIQLLETDAENIQTVIFPQFIIQ